MLNLFPYFRQDVLPRKAEWIKQSVVGFNPDESKLMTSEGDEISYEFLVVAMGLQLNYGQVPIPKKQSKWIFFNKLDNLILIKSFF